MFLEEVEEYTVQLAERIKYNQRLAEMEGTSRKDEKEVALEISKDFVEMLIDDIEMTKDRLEDSLNNLNALV